MKRTVYIFAISMLGAIGALPGCIASVDGTPTGEGEYNFDLQVGDISLEKFPAGTSGGNASGNGHVHDDTGNDSDENHAGNYCEMLCECMEDFEQMDYDTCMMSVSNLTDDQCREAYDASC
jgi:hypothetical protein